MTRILTIIALLFATPAWAGEVDGNSFYCPPNGLGTFSHYALQFQNEIAYGYNDSGGLVSSKYDVTAGHVYWELDDHFFHRMDRKTLVLVMVSNADGMPVARWECKFMNIADARGLVEQVGKQKDRDARKGNQF